MIRRLNYTKRTKIRAESVGITVREVNGALPTAAVSVSLDDYRLPDDAALVVEAYRKASYMRESMGTVSDHPEQHAFVLSEFPSAEGVRFRLKVIGRRDDTAHDAPLLLAVADRLTPREGDEGETQYEKLLRFVPADLEGEIWRLDIGDGPEVALDRAYWDERQQIVRSNWFFPLVLPTLLRETLLTALDDKYRELEDDDWRSHWLRFALAIPGEPELPAEAAEDEEIREWIDARVAAFCRDQKMKERFESAIRGGD